MAFVRKLKACKIAWPENAQKIRHTTGQKSSVEQLVVGLALHAERRRGLVGAPLGFSTLPLEVFAKELYLEHLVASE